MVGIVPGGARIGGGGGGGDLPGDYQYKVNESGQLELWKGDVKVAVQSPNGSWFRDSIGAGVGSLHLGGNESGGVAHSLSSAGQNIGFKNEFSRATDDDKLFFYPPWQAVTCDGDERIPPSYTRYTSGKTANYPVGADSYSGAVPYDFPVTITSNAEVYDVYIRLGEVYTGTVKNSIISNVTGAEIYANDVQISGTEGQTIRIKYKDPFRVRAGDNLQLRLIKEDGTNLMTHSGALDYNVPWRRIDSAAFEDAPIVGPSIGDVKHSFRTTDHEGWVVLDGKSTGLLSATQRANLVGSGINWATNLPDTRNRVITAAGGTFGVGSSGGSHTIQRSNLPNVTLSGTTAGGGQHAHIIPQLAFNTNTNSVPATSSTNPYAIATPTSWTLDSEVGGDILGTKRKYVAFDSTDASYVLSNTNHDHSVSGYTTQSITPTLSDHTHSYTTESINGNITQTQHLQPYIALTQFVFVGL